MESSPQIAPTEGLRAPRAPAKRNVTLLAAAVAVVLVAVTAVTVVAVTRADGEGPLLAEPGGGLAQPAAIGQAISISGPLVVLNKSDQPLVLDRINLVGLPSGMYRGAYALPWPPSKTPFTGALTYHVPRNGQTIPGATVAPHTRVWIVIGLTAKRGKHQWTRVDILYHDRDGAYRRHADTTGAVCASTRGLSTACHMPDAG